MALVGFGIATALLSWLLVGQLIRLAPRIGLLDRPNARSSHTKITPRGGGIGFVIAISVALGVWAVLAPERVAKWQSGKVGMTEGGQTTEDGGQTTESGVPCEALAKQGPRTTGDGMLVAGGSVTGDRWGDDRRQTVDGGRRTDGNDLSGTQEIRNGPAISVHRCASVVSTNSAIGPLSSAIGTKSLLVVLGAALFIAAISLRDDFKSLGPGLRFACHFAAAGAAVWALGEFRAVGVPLCPALGLCSAVGTVVTLLWIVGLTNVYNFLDGIDGIAGVQGLVAGLAWVVAGLAFGAPSTALLGTVLAAGCLGFLCHNWSPAKIFMGDVGSAFLGFLFAVVPLVAVREAPERTHLWPIFGALAVWPFLGDGFLTFVRRALKREKVWEAHRSHLYQRLTQTGWPHARVSLLYAGWAVVTAVAAYLWLIRLPGAALVALAWPLVSLKALFDYVSRRERRAELGRQGTE